MNWDRLCQLAAELPEVTQGLWYRTPGLLVRGKGFVRLKEDERTVVFRLGSVDQQELLIETQPDLYFITDHYRGYPAVLARLSALKTPDARARLREAWEAKAPRSLRRES